MMYYRFEDDDDIFGDKPRSGSAPAGGRRGRTAGSFLEDMLNNDDSNWLDMASGNCSNSQNISAYGFSYNEN